MRVRTRTALGSVLRKYLLVIVCFVVVSSPPFDKVSHCADISLTPVFGTGPYEVLIFTDYFCPPCQEVEPGIEPLLEKLQAGGAKVTFIDVPFHKTTPLYAKYYLYAANNRGTYQDTFRTRKALFHLAGEKIALSEDSLASALREKNISFRPYDVKPVFSEWNNIIKAYKIDSTPTLVIKYRNGNSRKYTGFREIMSGLSEISAEMRNARSR
ncbi:MAG: thioredoxin domain-containing protein [Syntrophales bacterium]|nr:thioredoxin domain-containing protein [Syntrophales bacterium]